MCCNRSQFTDAWCKYSTTNRCWTRCIVTVFCPMYVLCLKPTIFSLSFGMQGLLLLLSYSGIISSSLIHQLLYFVLRNMMGFVLTLETITKFKHSTATRNRCVLIVSRSFDAS